MLRLLAGLTLGLYFGFNAPKYIRQCQEMYDRYFQEMHEEASRKESE